ncbi:MAG: radical SAM protein [Candidatus Lokiarchaeota archaeon]|nr:radical SAM protein [Candidatus Lokiarchaeota archaeon]
MRVIKKEFKTALNKYKYPDSWFWARYSINPYSGCQHACTYCDARSERYYLNDFENEIVVKIDIDKKLSVKLKRARKLLPDVVGPGGVSDAYQPIEQEIENTRRILKVLSKFKFPVNIATKSSLITRDIDILKNIAKDSWCTVGFSITTTNEDLARFLEPYSSAPLDRLEAMKSIKKRAPEIQVGTYFMPIIPFLEDSDENLESVVKKSKESGADFVLFSPGLTLRDSQKAYFFEKLKKSEHSKIVKPLLKLCDDSIMLGNYLKEINSKMLELCNKYSLGIRLKRWIPNDYRKWNYIISQMLLNKYYKDSLTGKVNKSLLWAGLYLNNLEESIIDIRARTTLLQIRGFNTSVASLIERYLDRKNIERKSALDNFL